MEPITNISNLQQVTTQKKYHAIILISTISLTTLLLTGFLFRYEFLGLSRYLWTTIVVFIYVLYAMYRYKLDLNFFNIEFTPTKIIFRYLSLRPLANKRISIEIVNDMFYKYQTHREFFNQKELLTLMVKQNGKIAKYAPISLSALPEEDKILLKETLAKISLKNAGKLK